MVQSEVLHQKGFPPLPPAETIREAAYLVARGVRCLALVGSCPASDAASTRHTLLTHGLAGAVPFVIPDSEGSGAMCGYASHAWAVDLYRWTNREAPPLQRHRIFGLLLGYAPDAIRSFEELAAAGGTQP